MRMTILAILATFAVAILPGSPNAAVPKNMTTANSAYAQVAKHTCPAGYYWKRGMYNRYSRYIPPHCALINKK